MNEKERAAYEEEERLIAEARLRPLVELKQEIRWAYWSKINDSVYCMNEDGENLPAYGGKFDDLAERILNDAGPEVEFYISYSGEMEFVPVTREVWAK